MTPIICAGAAVAVDRVCVARWRSGEAVRRVESAFAALPGLSVSADALPPLTLRDARAVRAAGSDLRWLEMAMRRTRDWIGENHPDTPRSAFAVSDAMASLERTRWRETAWKTGWTDCRLVPEDAAAIASVLDDTAAPITVLLIGTGFETTTISLATGFGRAVRLRDRLRLPLLAHHLLDEVILTSCAAATGGPDAGPSRASELWPDVRRLREQLAMSGAGIGELEAEGWGPARRATATIYREDLWPCFAGDAALLFQAATELLERNRVPSSELGLVLFWGSGILAWEACCRLGESTLGKPPRRLADDAAAVGAAVLSAEAALPQFEPLVPYDPLWARDWETREPRRSGAVKARVENRTVRVPTAPPPPVPAAPAVRTELNPLDALEGYIRRLARERSGEVEPFLDQARDLIVRLRADLIVAKPKGQFANARLALQRGDLSAAVGESHRIAQNDPNDPAAFGEMIEIHLEAAELLRDHEEALRWLECALGHDPSNPRVIRQLADRYFRFAREQSDRGEYAQALATARRAWPYNPTDAAIRSFCREMEAKVARG